MIRTKEDLMALFRMARATPTMVYLITHGGTFHADDVFSTALLSAIFLEPTKHFATARAMKLPSLQFTVIRTSDPDEAIESIPPRTEEFMRDFIVYDIGGGDFDHHQEYSIERKTKDGAPRKPFASFGLLWEEFAPLFCEEDFVKSFDENFILPIDLQDNGIGTNPLSITISSMNPTWDSNVTTFEAFEKAVSFAKQILNIHMVQHESRQVAKAVIKHIVNQPRMVDEILVLENYLPCEAYLQETKSPVKYLIYPSNRIEGDWMLDPISKDVLLPDVWKFHDTQPIGLRFIHKDRFIASFKRLDDAISAARRLINSENRGGTTK